MPVRNPVLESRRRFNLVVWGVAVPTGASLELTSLGPPPRRKHPAPPPLLLIREALRRYSSRCELILDPFGGIGTTAVQAVRLARHFCLIERSRFGRIARVQIAAARKLQR